MIVADDMSLSWSTGQSAVLRDSASAKADSIGDEPPEDSASAHTDDVCDEPTSSELLEICGEQWEEGTDSGVEAPASSELMEICGEQWEQGSDSVVEAETLAEALAQEPFVSNEGGPPEGDTQSREARPARMEIREVDQESVSSSQFPPVWPLFENMRPRTWRSRVKGRAKRLFRKLRK